MADITVDDLPASIRLKFTDDDDAARALAAALGVARQRCGWHVTPVREDDELTVDGPCARVLDLPTRKLVDLKTVRENGTEVDVDRLNWSSNGSVRKRSGARWTCAYRAVTVTLDHGYAPAEAADWLHVVMSMVDRAAGSNTADEPPIEVGPFRWADPGSPFTVDDLTVLDSYALPSAFL